MSNHPILIGGRAVGPGERLVPIRPAPPPPAGAVKVIQRGDVALVKRVGSLSKGEWGALRQALMDCHARLGPDWTYQIPSSEVDRFLLEFDDERSGGFEPLRFVPAGKQGELMTLDRLLEQWEQTHEGKVVAFVPAWTNVEPLMPSGMWAAHKWPFANRSGDRKSVV